jgi:hypothetical protein
MSEAAGLAHTTVIKEPNTPEYIPTSQGPIRKDEANLVLRLVNTSRRGGLNIEGIVYDVLNPKTNKLDTLRLLKGVYTPWQSEQLSTYTDKQLGKMRRSIRFEDKVCVIPASDSSAIEFIKYCTSQIDSPNYGQGNKHSFYIHDPKRQADEQLEQAMKAMEQVQYAATCEEEPMRRHANYLGVVSHDEFGVLKNVGTIRREYMLKAQADWKTFKDTKDSPVVMVSYLIKRAIADMRIDIGKQPGMAYWAAGGFICKVPNATKAVDYLIEFAMLPAEEGKQFLAQLQANAQ